MLRVQSFIWEKIAILQRKPYAKIFTMVLVLLTKKLLKSTIIFTENFPDKQKQVLKL